MHLALKIIHIPKLVCKMKTFAFCFVALFAGALALPVFDDSKIVGGADTTVEEHPHQAGLRLNDTLICSATILSPTRALITANCFNRNNSVPQYSIIAGTTSRAGDETAQVRQITGILVHPQYNPTGARNNIALVRWDEPLTFGPTILPATLPEQDAPIPAGQNGTLTGWGRLSFNGSFPENLQAASKPVITNAECNQRYPDRVFDDMLCAGGLPEGGVGACTGDAGGPLRVANVLQGIVSWGRGNGCALPNSPVVYTRVAAFTTWINANL